MSAPNEPEPQPLAQTTRDKAAIALAIVGGLIALLALWLSLQQSQDSVEEARTDAVIAQGQAEVEEAQKIDLATKVRESCASGNRQVTRELGNLCNRVTRIVQSVPGPQGPMGPRGPRGPAPTEATVTRIVQNVIESRPGLVQSSVEDVVVDYLIRNPPEDGETPTRAEVREVVEEVYAANPPPPGEDGTDGKDGMDGETPEFEIRDDGHLIATYPRSGRTEDLGNVVGEDGEEGPRGPRGPQGPPGPPGPTCPDGYTGQEFTVETGDSPVNTDTRSIFACVPVAG